MNRLAFLKNIIGVGLLGLLGKNTNKKIPTTLVTSEIYRAHVRGLIHSPGKDLIKYLDLGTPINLVREPNNEYDECAIALYVQNQKIGYVPAEDNVILSHLLDAEHGRYTAEISDINHNAPHWEKIEFKIMSHQAELA